MPASADPLALVAMQAEEDPPPLRPSCAGVSPELDALVRAALERNPDARPSAEMLGRRLARVTAGPLAPLDDDLAG
jgi:hypothetical protein